MSRLGKIYYNIYDSDYVVEYREFKFYFSSLLYMKKFKNELKDYINDESFKIKNKYMFYLESDEYLALSYYKKIEKRGFYVRYNGFKIEENTTFKISLSHLNNV